MPDAAFLDRRLADLLDEIAARTPAPGGGSVAALAVTMAAALVEMAARFSGEVWREAPGAVAQADALRRRAAPLAQADADAYTAALAVLRSPQGDDPRARDESIRRVLARAADVPLEIAEVAIDVALLGAEVAEHGNPNLRGDAAAGAALAEAGARIAANLVAINLATTSSDERLQRAVRLLETATGARLRASGPR